MRRALLLFFCFASYSLFGQDSNVEISLEAPSTVVAGEEFEVTVAFIKGDLKDYSRFSQDLPSGITARNIDSRNADFTFSEQRVRIIWLKLPPENEIVVRYALTANERVKGSFSLGGTFAFVENGERTYLNIPDPKTITIQPNPKVSEDQIVDLKDFNKLKESVNQISEEQYLARQKEGVVFRQKPVLENDGSVSVILLIKNPKASRYIKLEEIIPKGYTMEEVDSHGAVVSKSANISRFVWMKPPSEDLFTIEYRLVPLFGVEQGDMNIKGSMSFSENEETKVVTIDEVNINLLAMNRDQQNTFLTTGDIPDGLPTSATKTQARKKTKTSEPSKLTKNKGVNYAYLEDGKKSFVIIPKLEAKPGTYFRVQVAAVRRPYFAGVVFARYSLLEDVEVEILEGWSKFTLGSFSSYGEAKSMISMIQSKTPVHGAFVVGYKDGKRVPLSSIL